MVFISWSGQRSLLVARILNRFLREELRVETFFSEDIERGVRWREKLEKALSRSSYGIFVITRDNAEAPWLLFEAGAVAREFESAKVCTLLIEPDATGLPAALSQFQRTEIRCDDQGRQDFEHLMLQVNQSLFPPLPESRIGEKVKDFWHPLSDAVRQAQDMPVVAQDYTSVRVDFLRAPDIADLQMRVARVGECLNFLATSVESPAYFLDEAYNITYANLAADLVFDLRMVPGEKKALTDLLDAVGERIRNRDQVMENFRTRFLPPETAPACDFEVIEFDHWHYGYMSLRKIALAVMDAQLQRNTGWVVAFNITEIAGLEKFYNDFEGRIRAFMRAFERKFQPPGSSPL